MKPFIYTTLWCLFCYVVALILSTIYEPAHDIVLFIGGAVYFGVVDWVDWRVEG